MSSRLPAALLLWINSLSTTLPSLCEVDSNGINKRTVKSLGDLSDGVVLGDVVGEM